MYPFIDSYVPDDFPQGILAFINSVILFHVCVLVFYFCGLARDILVGAPPKEPTRKVAKNDWVQLSN